MNKSTNNDSTGTRDPGNQFTGGASGASGLKAGDSLKATVAPGSSLKSQGETRTKVTGNNKVIYFIVTICMSMKLRTILFFIVNTKEPLFLTITYLTCTLSILKTIRMEISLCSIKPDITLLIIYGPNIYLYDYQIIVKRFLIYNVHKQRQCNYFCSYPTRKLKCCQFHCSKSIAENLTTYVPSVLYTRTFNIIKMYYNTLETKQCYAKKHVTLLVNIFFHIKYNKLISIPFQGGAKRKGQTLEEPKAVRRRAAMKDLFLNYAELSKTHTMLEVRASDPDIQLDQEDFEQLDASIVYLHLDLKPTPDFGVVKMGLSQGGVWIACKDNETVEFITDQTPGITPPEAKASKKEYLYRVYGPNNRPYKYYKLRVPERFWNTPERFIELIKHFNKELDMDFLSGSFFKTAHLRVSSGLVDRAKEINQGYFFVTLEVDEKMVEKLAAKNGLIMIGPNSLEIIGGGIDKAIDDYEKKQKEQERAEEMELVDTLNYSA